MKNSLRHAMSRSGPSEATSCVVAPGLTDEGRPPNRVHVGPRPSAIPSHSFSAPSPLVPPLVRRECRRSVSTLVMELILRRPCWCATAGTRTPARTVRMGASGVRLCLKGWGV